MRFTKREIQSSGEGSKLFLRLKDGETVTGVLKGEVFEYFIKWENGRSQIVAAGEPGGKSRFRVNFVTPEGTALVAKIWEFGLTVYNQLAELSEEYDLDKTKIKVTRRGTGTDTIYMVIPLLKEPLKPAQLKAIEAVECQVLEPKQRPEPPPPAAGNDYDEHSEIPF